MQEAYGCFDRNLGGGAKPYPGQRDLEASVELSFSGPISYAEDPRVTALIGGLSRLRLLGTGPALFACLEKQKSATQMVKPSAGGFFVCSDHEGDHGISISKSAGSCLGSQVDCEL